MEELDKVITNSNTEFHLRIIKLIGEPFIREKLLEMFYLAFDKQKRITELEIELAELKK
jgi:hypothetical protein